MQGYSESGLLTVVIHCDKLVHKRKIFPRPELAGILYQALIPHPLALTQTSTIREVSLS